MRQGDTPYLIRTYALSSQDQDEERSVHWLAGDLRDQFVITVVVQDGDAFSFGHRRDQHVGQADRPHASAVPQGGLAVNRASPVLIVGGHPLMASVAVSSYLIELRTAPGCPSKFELDDTAGGYHSRLDQRRQDSCHFRMVQAGGRAGVKPSTVDQIPTINSLVSTTRMRRYLELSIIFVLVP